MYEKFTVCVLLHGDYPSLAKRCLGSIFKTIPERYCDIRVGLNGVGEETQDFVYQQIPAVNIFGYDNAHKYPRMREMVHGREPVTTKYFMWFDDDSYLAADVGEGWLRCVEESLQNANIIGSIYTMAWQGNQRDWVKAQPWYAGNDPYTRPRVRFATGGWWAVHSDLLYRYDYPWGSLDHNGGDTMLGEMCLQQQLTLRHFNYGVHINADETGRESKSPRRGDSQKPIGFDFSKPERPAILPISADIKH